MSRLAEHQPTELEVGIVPMDSPNDPYYEKPTNTFQAPETDSDDEPLPFPVRLKVWKPFSSEIAGIHIDSPVVLPPIIDLEAFGEDSDGTSNNDGDVMKSPIIDLTNENPWVAAPPIHLDCTSTNSDNVPEYYGEEDMEEEDDYDEEEDYDDDEEDDELSDYECPPEPASEESPVVNVEPQVPETQVAQQEENQIQVPHWILLC